MADSGHNFSHLFKERSLWELSRQAPSLFRNRFNRCTLILTIFVLTAYAGFDCYRVAQGSLPNLAYQDLFLAWATNGIALTGTILGFLIAGLSIWLTAIAPELLVKLDNHHRPDHNESELKLICLIFIDVFTQYVSFLFFCVAYLTISGKGGVIDAFARPVWHLSPILPVAISHFVFVAWGTWFLGIVLKLKSFIFNLYQSLLLAKTLS